MRWKEKINVKKNDILSVYMNALVCWAISSYVLRNDHLLWSFCYGSGIIAHWPQIVCGLLCTHKSMSVANKTQVVVIYCGWASKYCVTCSLYDNIN